MTMMMRFMRDDNGATAIEYGLIAGLIALVIIVAVRSVGTRTAGRFSVIANNLT